MGILTLEQLVGVINSESGNYGNVFDSRESEVVAAEYVIEACIGAGDGFAEENIDFHMQHLANAGANFDESKALHLVKAELKNR